MKRGLVPGLVLVAGLVMVFHPTLFSGFARLQTDLGDTRLNAYILEHGWRWLTRAPEARLWHPAFFYPAPDALAYSDLMLSFGPLYWPWRAAGLGEVLSFQLWMLSVAICNFVICYAFLRRRASFDRLGSALGSFVISFAASRAGQLGHQQMLPIFFVIGALWAVWSLAAAAAAPEARRQRSWAVAALFGCLVAQLYGGYYNFAFALALLTVTVLSALAGAASRRVLVDVVRGSWRAMLVASCTAVVLAFPAASHYLETAGMVGARRPGAALAVLPRLVSYVFVSGRSWWYRWMSDLPWIRDLPIRHEHAVGLGFITTGCLLWVAWKARSRPAARLVVTIVLVMGLLVTMFPDRIRLWMILYHAFPPFQGVRAVSRIGMLLAIPAGVAIAWMVSRRAAGLRGRIVVTIAVLACLEQGVTTPSVEVGLVEARAQEVAQRVDLTAEAFLVVPQGSRRGRVWHQLDAMWAQQRTGVPTVNGYSGNRPPGWDFDDLRIRRAGDLDEARRRLEAWAERMAIDAGRIQIVPVDASLHEPDRAPDADRVPPSRSSQELPGGRAAAGPVTHEPGRDAAPD